jgi:ATP-dependent DNA helicase RecG
MLEKIRMQENIMSLIESETVELKRELTDDVVKTVLAFANSGGGTLFIGVEDDSSICGILEIDQVLTRVSNMVRDSVVPDVTQFVSYAVNYADGKQILEVTVRRGTDRPYALKSKGINPNGVFVRQGSSSVRASMDTIRMMITETAHRHFEREPSPIQSLTFSYIAPLFEERALAFGEAQHQTLKLRNSQGDWTGLALLLSDQCTHTTKIALFQGTGVAVFRDRREFSGSLLSQLEKSIEYLHQHNRIRSEFPGMVRMDRYDYPVLAIREMLLNAYTHRLYSVSSPTLIHLFDDRVESITVGGLAPGLTMEDVLLGVSVSRNEYLVRVLHQLGIIEAYGTGILRMFEQYAAYECKPIIEVSPNAFKLTLPNRNYLVERVGEMEGVYEAYLFIKKHELATRADLQHYLGCSQTQAGLVIRALVEKGIVRTVGKGKNIRYRAM